MDRRLKCGTCKRSLQTCPGHFGSINLNFPVLHPGFIDIVLKILRCVCFFCSELLLLEKDQQALKKIRDRKQRLSAAMTLGKVPSPSSTCRPAK